MAEFPPDRSCFVCGDALPLDTDELHTYHAEGCPERIPVHDFQFGAANYPSCAGLSGCGEDVHPECCPTCTGRAF